MRLSDCSRQRTLGTVIIPDSTEPALAQGRFAGSTALTCNTLPVGDSRKERMSHKGSLLFILPFFFFAFSEVLESSDSLYC